MTWLRILAQRWMSLFRKRRLDQELDEELRSHLEMLIEENILKGMSSEEARYAARRSLGGVEQMKEVYREQRGLPVIETLVQDLRYGLRMLLKNRGFTAVAVLTLALGIGANTAIFSLINVVMLRMLPVREPERLALFAEVDTRGTWESFSYPLYERFLAHQGSFTGICAATSEGRMRMTVSAPGGGSATEPARTEKVSGNFFSVLGVNAVLGRTLTPADDRPGDPQPVVVISHGFWQRRFGRETAVVGKNILLNDVTFTIVGVAPPGFFGFEVGSSPDVWLPLQMHPQVSTGPFKTALKEPGFGWLQLMGRLQPGASLEAARAEMDVVYQRRLAESAAAHGSKWSEEERRKHFARKVVLQSGATGWTELRKNFRQPLFLLMGAVGLVLLIACANVANLSLAQAASRQKELALRLAIGAGRGRLFRQLLTESFLLAGLGGTLGTFFALWGTELLLTYLPRRPDPVLLQVGPDGRVFAFTLGVSVLTGLLFGLAPALRNARLDLTAALKEQTGGTSASRLKINKILVITQVALSLFLLAGAGLFVRSLQKLKSIDTGFTRENLLQFGLDSGQGYDVTRLVLLYRRTLERLESLPGVRAASFTSIPLLTGSGWSDVFVPEGYAPQPNEKLNFHGMRVGPRFFETMGIPLLLGRDFTPRDTRPAGKQAEPSAPSVAVINQSLARRFFGTDNPLGRRFTLSSRAQEPIEIVGVVTDAKYRNLRDLAPPTFYVPFFQRPNEWRVTFEVRTLGDPSSLVAALPPLLREIDPRLQVLGSDTMEQMVDESLLQERILAQLAGFFSVSALLLSALGLYGVLAYGVACRRREIGIRLAVGAKRHEVIVLVIKQGLKLVCVGALIGLSAALAVLRVVKSLLYEVAPTDPPTFAGVTLLLALVALLACWLPARRAARIDPMVTLRCE
jgi:putative ABC transport system permease protein